MPGRRGTGTRNTIVILGTTSRTAAFARQLTARLQPLARVHPSLDGMNAIVMGRSNLVGRPLVQLLLNENATVTIAHSRTRDLANICRQADLLLAAVGKPEMVKADWIKPGATVIDVGINRVTGADCKSRLVGDVAYQEAAIARAAA